MLRRPDIDGMSASSSADSQRLRVSIKTTFDAEVVAAGRSLRHPLDTPSIDELKAYADARQEHALRIVLLRAGEHWVGLSVCFAGRDRVHGLMLRTYRVFGYQLYDYNAIRYEDPFLPALLQAMQADARSLGCDAVLLDNLSEELSALWGHPGQWTEELEIVALHADGARTNSIQSKKSFQRDSAYFRKQPGYRVVHKFGDFSEDEVAVLAALHVERWTFDGVVSAFARSSSRLREYCSHSDNKLLSFIYVGDEVVACHYGMVLGHSLIFHTPVVNIKFLDRSPMKTLLFELSSWCSEHGIRILDLGLGDEAYKASVSNGRRSVTSYFLPVSLPGRAALLVRRFLRIADVRSRVGVMQAWLASRAAAWRSATRPLDFYRTSGPVSQAAPDRSRLLLAETYRGYVDLARQLGVAPKRLAFDRLKGANSFCALVHESGEVLATAWINRSGTFHAADVGCTVANPGGHFVYEISCQTAPSSPGKAALLRQVARAVQGTVISYALRGDAEARSAFSEAGFHPAR